MTTHDALLLDSRRRVYEFVQTHPGVHLRAVARETGYPLGTTLYHLDCLVKVGLVAVRFDGRYKRFFAGATLDRRARELIAVFRHGVPRRLVAQLVAGGPGTQRALAAELGVSRSTLSFHASALVRQDVVRCEVRWPENSYVSADPPLHARILLDLHEGSPDPFVEARADRLRWVLAASDSDAPRPAPAAASAGAARES